MSNVFFRRLAWRTYVLIGFESVLIIGAVFGAAYVLLGQDAVPLLATRPGSLKVVLIALVCQICLYYGDLYDLRLVADRRELFTRTIQALGITSLVLAALYYWFPDLIIGRGVFLISSIAVIAVVVGWRVAFAWLSRHARPRERLLLVGTSSAAVELAHELYGRRSELGVEIVGFVDADSTQPREDPFSGGLVGAIADIPRIVREHSVDRVVVSLADARGKLPMDQLLKMRLTEGVRFAHLATVYEEYTGKIAVDNLRPSWLIFSDGFRKSRWLLAAKRASDAALSAVGLVVTSPILGLATLAIKATSPGPVLYHQRRVGQHGRIFTIHKFRSMQVDAEADTGAVWSQPGRDSRVTAIGRILRRTRIDELPQLWNVLVGEMSFVGPRPERPEFVEKLTHEIPFYGQRHVVRPGVTGWAQVCHSYGASVADAMEKLQYEIFYIKNLSIALDWYIILETIKTVLVRQGS